MYAGKTLFAQVMDFLPWTTFHRIVKRYQGNHRIRTLPCAEQFRVTAFAQLTYRESLRDIESCLAAQARKLYASDSLGAELDNTVYALDSTTIDLCLSLFPWANFRSTKAAVKVHTLLDLRGGDPQLYSRLRRAPPRRQHPRYAAARAGRLLHHESRLSRL